jgi:hypothetical protein
VREALRDEDSAAVRAPGPDDAVPIPIEPGGQGSAGRWSRAYGKPDARRYEPGAAGRREGTSDVMGDAPDAHASRRVSANATMNRTANTKSGTAA